MQEEMNEARMLRDLAALNRRFLAIASRGVSGPAPVGAEVISALEPAAMARLAGLPFTLFSFGFGADRCWEVLCARGVRDAEGAGPEPDRARERFVLLGLAFLRQAVVQDACRAAVFAGVPRPIGTWLAELEFGDLVALAPTAAACLRWRFPAQARFWGELMRACRTPDEALLPVLRAAGVQWTIRRALALEEEACRRKVGFRVRGAGGR